MSNKKSLIRMFKDFVPQRVKNDFYHFVKALLAVVYYGFPARDLVVIGVTGTDGKTTTATMVYYLLKGAGKKVALISTVSAYIGDKKLPTGLHVTSPDPWELQRLLKVIKDRGFRYVVLESTSHGLDQYRLFGTNVHTAVLTNITHEHIDYHGSYDKYLTAKAKLFRGKVSILNKDDKSYNKIKKLAQGKMLSYDSKTLKGKLKDATNKRFSERYNRMNFTAAYLAAKEHGVTEEKATKLVKSFRGIAGRMEEVSNKKGLRIIIDFAHTPNALEKVLTALKKKQKSGKLIAVFGCASERDDDKRPMMAKISTKLADVSVFTAEDPRHEDIEKIIDEMEEGVAGSAKKDEYTRAGGPDYRHKGKRFYRVPERGEAIYFAINRVAKKGDTVGIFGKGHEKSMSYNGVEYPWSDRKAVEMALRGKIERIAKG